MYGNNTFDGAAAFSGGGFMPSQTTQTADPSLTPAKSRETKCILPLTVKQISGALSDDKANFQIDGVDANNVKLVGLLFEKMENVTNVSFVLDDGTGQIGCNRWVNESRDTREMELLSDGMYVTVHGHLKGFQGKTQVMVYSIRRVTDYNEIPNHFADCMYVHCYNTKTGKMQHAPQVTGQMPNTAVNTPSKGHQPTSSNHFSVQHNVDGTNRDANLLKAFIQDPSIICKEEGLHRADIAKQLNFSENRLMAAIKVLDEEGLIYTTTDDDHYRSTVNG